MKSKIKYLLGIIFTLCLMWGLQQSAEASTSLTSSKTVEAGSVTVEASVSAGDWNLTLSGAGQTKTMPAPSGEGTQSQKVSITFTAEAGKSYDFTLKGDETPYVEGQIVEATSVSKSCKITVKAADTQTKDENTGNTSTDPKQNPGTEPQKKTETKEEKSKSSENHLSSLSTSVGTLDPAFRSDNLDYTLKFPEDYDMSELKTIEISAKGRENSKVTSGTGTYEVKEGENEIIVYCKAENDDVRAYRIKFTKEVKTQQSDLRLKTFSITKVREEDKKQVLAQLNEEFKPDVFEYTMDLDEETKELNIDFEIEEKFKDKINVEITGNKDLKPGENIITIKLTSKDDEKVTTTYTIRVNKAGAVEETQPETKSSGSLNIKLIIIIVGSIVGLLVLILIILLIVNHFQKKKAKEAMKADDDNNFVGGDNGFDADIGHDIKPVGVASLDEESDSNYDFLSRDEEADEDEEDEKRFGRSGYNTIHQDYDSDDEDEEEYGGIDDTDLPEGTVSEHMINAKLNGEADELKRRYEIDELQEEIADELKDKKTKRKGRGRRFK